MITNYELIDLKFAFRLLRDDIKCEDNLYVISELIKLFSNKNNLIVDNCIRKTINKYVMVNKKWEFVNYYNYYVDTTIYKEGWVFDLFFIAFSYLKKLLEEQSYEKAKDFADALHILPEIIMGPQKKSLCKYLKSHIRPFVKKWGKEYEVICLCNVIEKV